MNRLTLILFFLALIGIGGGVAWYLVDSRNDAFSMNAPITVPAPEINEGLSMYTNGTYGFSIFYPEPSDVRYVFDSSYHLGSLWRANALPEQGGQPLVAIVPYHTKSEDSYPRYFSAMVRIGVSYDALDVARCEEPSTEQGEVTLPDALIGGRVWKAFSFQSAGMMQYVEGVSYRVLLEGRCLALEKIKTGSIYRDQANERDIPKATLDAEYAKLDSVVESFTFAPR